MISWKNLDTLAVYKKFMALKGKVNLVEAMSGEEAAERVAKYSQKRLVKKDWSNNDLRPFY